MPSTSRINLYITTVIINIAVFSVGSLYSWSSPSIPKLRAKDSWLPIDTDQASWIGSLIAFGSIFGPFLGGWLVDHVGRRPAVVFAIAVTVMSWAVLYQAQRVWEIYVSRIIAGIGGGIIFAAVPLYVGELAEDEVRSALASLFNFFFTAGLLLEYIVGPYVSFWNLIWVSCVAPVVFLLACPWIPESPYFHLKHDQIFKAQANLAWLRRGASEEQIGQELTALKDSIDDAQRTKGSFLDLFRTRGSRRALLLSMGAVTFQQLSGINVVLFYSQHIFEMAGEVSIGPSESTIIVGVVLLVSAALAVPLTHVFGMKLMLLVSALGMSLFLGLLGLYFFLLAGGNDTSSYNWLPIASLIGYVIIYSFGLGPLPWAVMGEVFPPNVKGYASALTSSCCWAVAFAITKLFPILTEILGTYTVFWAFAVFCIFAFFFMFLLLPDTRGLSLQEIHDMLEESTTPTPYTRTV